MQVRSASRRVALLSVLAASVALAAPVEADAADRPVVRQLGHDARLVVADPAAQQVYVYSARTNRLLDTVDATFVDHAGFRPLADGRVLFVDEISEGKNALVALDVTGTPKVVGSAPVEGEVSHIAVDAEGRYAVAAAAEPHEETGKGTEQHGHGTLTVLDLETYESASAVIHTGHPGVTIGGSDGAATVIHRNDEPAQLETYPVSEILAHDGEHLEPTSIVPVGEHGHGEAYLHDQDRTVTATDAGVDTARLLDGKLGEVESIDWPELGRGYYLRLDPHGRQLTSYASTDEGTDWQNWNNDAILVDPRTNERVDVQLEKGYLFRHTQSASHAGYVIHQPDGDKLQFVDTRTGSPHFGEVTATVELGKLDGGPVPDELPYDAQIRRVASSPDGSLVYTTAGGAGRVDIVSPDLGKVVGSIQTPTPLDAGGALAVVQPGIHDADTIGR